jgi:hypothetical protein
MGTDIHIYAETRNNQSWEPIPHISSVDHPIDVIDLYHSRPYRLFFLLSGVQYGDFIGVTEPLANLRNLPDDLNPKYNRFFDRNGTGMACSCLTVKLDVQVFQNRSLKPLFLVD